MRESPMSRAATWRPVAQLRPVLVALNWTADWNLRWALQRAPAALTALSVSADDLTGEWVTANWQANFMVS